jgi:hypothetical protein
MPVDPQVDQLLVVNLFNASPDAIHGSDRLVAGSLPLRQVGVSDQPSFSAFFGETAQPPGGACRT